MCRFTYRSWIGPFIFFVPSFFKEEFQKEIKGSMCFSKKISFPSQVRVRQSKSIVPKHISWFALPKGVQIVSLYDISKYNKPLEWCCVSKLKRYLPEKRLEMCWQFEFKGMSCDSYPRCLCVCTHEQHRQGLKSTPQRAPVLFCFAMQLCMFSSVWVRNWTCMAFPSKCVSMYVCWETQHTQTTTPISY
jgi:hypothetical protein